jgi:hypothetical protein
MPSTEPRGTLGSVASLLAATLYQGNPDRNHKLWNIVSIERYILHIQVLLECCYIIYRWKVHNGKIEIISFVVNGASFVLLFQNERAIHREAMKMTVRRMLIHYLAAS